MNNPIYTFTRIADVIHDNVNEEEEKLKDLNKSTEGTKYFLHNFDKIVQKVQGLKEFPFEDQYDLLFDLLNNLIVDAQKYQEVHASDFHEIEYAIWKLEELKKILEEVYNICTDATETTEPLFAIYLSDVIKHGLLRGIRLSKNNLHSIQKGIDAGFGAIVEITINAIIDDINTHE